MKKFLAALLVLSMLLATAAFAACDIKANTWVEFKRDSAAYTAARSSKKTESEVQKGSTARCDKVCGKYARLIVNEAAITKCWFKVDDLKNTDKNYTKVVWAKGGKGMSSYVKDTITTIPAIKGFYVKVSGHTNLRRSPSLKCKSQGVVKKGDLLKLTGRVGLDDRGIMWVEVCKGGKKLWLSMYFVKCRADGRFKYYDKNGKCVEPVFD